MVIQFPVEKNVAKVLRLTLLKELKDAPVLSV
jgi:hypothetical protein